MHELSICQALLIQVRDIAQAHNADAVIQITVAVGPLSGVEPSLLAEAFRWARLGSCAERAELSFESDPVKVHCIECGAESVCAANCLLCGECRGFRTQLVSGDELRLLRIELSSAQQDALPSSRLN